MPSLNILMLYGNYLTGEIPSGFGAIDWVDLNISGNCSLFTDDPILIAYLITSDPNWATQGNCL